jgi:hypothetical protein
MGGAAAAALAIPEAAILGLIAAGMGRRICRRLVPDADPTESSVFGFPVGMALLSLLTTALLFARVPGSVLPGVLGSALIGAAAWGRRDAVSLARSLAAWVRESPVQAAVLAVSAMLGAVGALAPETGWDSGVYHFAMARMRAEQGAMVVRFDVPQGFRPAYLGSLHSLGFLLNGEALASLINESYYFAGLALARLWGLRLGGERAGLFAALAWMGSITYVLRMDGGDVEVAQAVYLGVALLALLRLRDGGSSRWRVLAGGAIGLFVGLKYTSLYAVLLLALAWLVVRLADRTPLRALLLDGVVIGLLGAALAAPWYVRNKLVTGGFFYPFQASESSTWTGIDNSAPGAGPAAFRSLAMDGFILVGLATLLLPCLRRDRWTALVPLALAPWLLRRMGWTEAGVTNALRYASPAWLPLLVSGGAGVAWAMDRGKPWGRPGLAMLLAATALSQGVMARRNLPKVPVALGWVSRDEYLGARVSTYRATRAAEASLPPGKRILLVEERVYYCRAPFLAAFDPQTVVDFNRMRSAEDVRRFLERESIGAIVVDRTPNAKVWLFRDLERRLGADWPPPGVRAVTIPGDASLYRVD